MELISIEAQAVITPVEAAADGKPQRPKLEINAYNGGAMRVAGYKNPVVIDLAGLTAKSSVPILRSHNTDRIVGHGTASIDAASLSISGVVSAKGVDAQEVTDLAAEGFPWQASVGVQPTKIEDLKAGAKATVNGNEITGPKHIARTSELNEVSVLPLGADNTTSARISARKSKSMETNTVDAIIEAQNKEVDNLVAYEKIIQAAIDRGMRPELGTQLVDAAQAEKADVREFELKVLRLSRAPTVSSQRHSTANASAEVIEAAICRSIGDSDALDQFEPEVLEASEKQFKHGLGLVELMQMSARRNGHNDISRRDIRALMQAAFAPIHASSGVSTFDLTGVLSNLANKMIKAGFDSVENTWQKVSAVKPVNDFKQTKSYSLTGDFTFKEVPPSGELTSATMGEVAYTNQAKTYGRLFGLTRTDFINDDLGAFNNVRTMLGRGAALGFNKIFWTEFLSELSTFYTTGNKNRITASALAALDVDGLSKAFELFSDQVDPDGNPMGISPALLLVPNALKVTAERLTNAPEIRINGASAKTTYTTNNPHAGKVEAVASSYLNNANIAGGSAAHWFMLADPVDLPVIEACFLYGRTNPIIESAQADFDTLGVQLRGYMDFGVNLQEYRAGVYSDGTTS